VNEVGAGRALKKSGREEKGRRSGGNGREVKRREWREWKRRDQGRLDRERRDAANVIVGKERLGKEDVRTRRFSELCI